MSARATLQSCHLTEFVGARDIGVMIGQPCGTTMKVKSSVLPLFSGGFSFQAQFEGKDYWCVDGPGFDGECPNLEINDEITVEFYPGSTLGRKSQLAQVVYLKKVSKKNPSPFSAQEF